MRFEYQISRIYFPTNGDTISLKKTSSMRVLKNIILKEKYLFLTIDNKTWHDII